MNKPEYLDLAKKILERIAHKYTFAYFAMDDIIQEGLLIADANYIKWDKVRCPEKFLFVNLSTRLKNLYREKCCRNDSPCRICNNGGSCDKVLEGEHKCENHKKWQNTQNKRRNIVNMAPIRLNDKGETADEAFLTKNDVATQSVDCDDFNGVVSGRLTDPTKILFDMVIMGDELSKQNLIKLQSEVSAILEGMKIE